MIKHLLVEDLKNKIPIKTICYDGSWIGNINGNKIELKHMTPDTISLFVNNVVQPIRWKVYEQVIKNLKLANGGFCPADQRFVFYVYGNDGRRYRHLYINETNIGTRGDHGAKYLLATLSHKQRQPIVAARRIAFGTRRLKRLRARERARDEPRRI